MTNKLVVIIKSLKVPKIKKILLYEMKFLVPNYSRLQNPRLGGYRPPGPRSLCPLSSAEFVEPPHPEQNSWVRHWYTTFLPVCDGVWKACSVSRREPFPASRIPRFRIRIEMNRTKLELSIFEVANVLLHVEEPCENFRQKRVLY